MSLTTLSRGRRLLSAVTVAALTSGVLAFTPTAAHADHEDEILSGTISWGLKSSFRTYLAGQFAHGTITAGAPATDNGQQTVFTYAAGAWAPGGWSSVGTEGSVNFTAHEGALDLTISDPIIQGAGVDGELLVDAVDSDGNTHENVVFATIDLSGKVNRHDGGFDITAAPTYITAEGAELLSYQGRPFYAPGTELDPISAALRTHAAPTLSVSKLSFGPDETATVTVTGSNFYPRDSALGTRPPLAGRKSGFYLTFGKFNPDWRPSDNAASSTRKIASQKWLLERDVYNDVKDQAAFSSQAVLLNPDGTFTTTLEISKAAADAVTGVDATHTQYGIYTLAGSGAVVAGYETYTPVSFVPAAPTAKNVSTTYAKGATVSVTAPVPGKVTVVGLGEQTATAAGQVLKFSVPKGTTAGTKTYTVRFTPADTGLTAPAATTVTVKIAKRAAYKATVKVTKKPTSRKKGKAKVTVKGVKGAAAPTGKVRIKLVKGKKSKTVTLKLNKKGVATKKLPKLAKGTWKVRVSYLGNANYTKRGFVKAGKIKVTK